MKKITLLVSGLLLITGTTFGALDNEEQAKVDQLAKVLRLSSEQVQKLSKSREADKRKLLSLEKKWQLLHDRLRQEVRKDKPDKAVIAKISNDIGSVQGEIVSLRTNALVYLKSLLTPSQITILENGRPLD